MESGQGEVSRVADWRSSCRADGCERTPVEGRAWCALHLNHVRVYGVLNEMPGILKDANSQKLSFFNRWPKRVPKVRKAG